MKVMITGVGDAFTCRHFGSSAVVRGPEGLLLIDCPDLIHRALTDASAIAGWNVGVADINDIVLTHLHGDHCNGLESFGFYRRFLHRMDSKTGTPRLHTTAPVAARLWERLAPAMDAPMQDGKPSTLEDYFDVHIIEPDADATIAGLTVRCRFTGHSIPTIGLTVRHPDGAMFGWSGDTPFEAAHIEWLSAAHVIVHECNLGPVHTHIEDLEALPAAIRDRMHLIHLPDDFDPTSTSIAVLREGEVLSVETSTTRAANDANA
ncbi:MAG: MBL fold metallo-hydrolase [Planctomycetota bacterium]